MEVAIVAEDIFEVHGSIHDVIISRMSRLQGHFGAKYKK
jgi:hypothetical protein